MNQPLKWFDVPNGVTQRIVARCGATYPRADIDPHRTALVVVDLQGPSLAT